MHGKVDQTNSICSRLEALEQQYSALQVQMRSQKELFIGIFRTAIAALESTSNAEGIDNGEDPPVTAVNNGCAGFPDLKVDIKLANMAAAHVRNLATARSDRSPPLKRRRTLSDTRSAGHDPPELTNPPETSEESGEIEYATGLFPDSECDHVMRERTKRFPPPLLKQSLGATDGGRDCAAPANQRHNASERHKASSGALVKSNEARGHQGFVPSGYGRSRDPDFSRRRNVYRSRSCSRDPSHRDSRDRRSSNSRRSSGKNSRDRTKSRSRSRNKSRYSEWDGRRLRRPRSLTPLPAESTEYCAAGSNAELVGTNRLQRGGNANQGASSAPNKPPQVVPEPSKRKSRHEFMTWDCDVGDSKHVSVKTKDKDAGWPEFTPLEHYESDVKGWGVIDLGQHESEWPTMPASVNQLTSKTAPLSSHDKVAAWKGAELGATDAEPISGSGDLANDALSCSGSEDLGDIAQANSFVATNPFSDDDDDDDGDPRMNLFSKQRRSELVVSMLSDSGGVSLTMERMAPLWRIFAWIPLDTLPEAYRQFHSIDLWVPETKKQIRSLITDLPDLSERVSMNGSSRQTLIFKSKSHLNQSKACHLLVGHAPTFEPVLFFYLVTTVQQPLEYGQAKMISFLWSDEFGKKPTSIATTKHAGSSVSTKWESEELLWRAAVDWLCKLARLVMDQGLGYLRSKATNWSATTTPARYSSDPEKDLVSGLLMDDLSELLKATPVLLRNILDQSDLCRLKSELGQ